MRCFKKGEHSKQQGSLEDETVHHESLYVKIERDRSQGSECNWKWSANKHTGNERWIGTEDGNRESKLYMNLNNLKHSTMTNRYLPSHNRVNILGGQYKGFKPVIRR